MNSSSTPLSRRRGRVLAQTLVDWYEGAQRDLPWRQTRDPYAIWVSEVMLQQTRVEVVRGRWESFLRRFPSLQALAEAPRADVLAEWAGLGYYRRAHLLHEAARAIAENAGGELPCDAAALRLLPGFGPYTAGAVASIAFDQPVAAVDGNVERVLSRLLALDGDPKRGATARCVRQSAQILVECASPNLVTQALMELGALLCTPRAPRCAECPWASGCAGRRSGVPESFPRTAPRPETLQVAAYALVSVDGERLLWRRRPEGGTTRGSGSCPPPTGIRASPMNLRAWSAWRPLPGISASAGCPVSHYFAFDTASPGIGLPCSVTPERLLKCRRASICVGSRERRHLAGESAPRPRSCSRNCPHCSRPAPGSRPCPGPSATVSSAGPPQVHNSIRPKRLAL